MVDSIAMTLGAGSGVDITALVTSLVDNQYAVKNAQFTKQSETLTTQLSAVSQLKSAITGFSTALNTLIKGGTLASQATSANAGVVKATTLPGATLSGLSATVEVRAMAAAQVSNTAVAIPAATSVGTGSIQIAIGSYDSGSFVDGGTVIPPITIAAGEDNLSSIATKINAAKTGITASVVTDSTGQRLVMKGANGAAQAFTLSVTEDAGAPGLSTIEVGAGKTGTTSASTAADARVAIDGVEVRRASNSISDLIPGVRLDLQSVAIGSKVAIGSEVPTAALTQVVNDVVATYNELYALLKKETDPVTGSLKGDPAARNMLTQLRNLTLTDLTGAIDGSPSTLADLGVATARDGTLSVNASRLADVINRYPNAVVKMFADGVGATKRGLGGAIGAITTKVTSTQYGLGASEQSYTKAQSRLAESKDRIATAAEATRTRLTQQYSSSEARVAAYKSTQAFLTQQVAAWNSSN